MADQWWKSVADLTLGYYGHVAPDDVCKMAMMTPFEMFEFLQMLFGLSKAVQTFKSWIINVLKGLDGFFLCIDDLLIAIPNKEMPRHIVIFCMTPSEIMVSLSALNSAILAAGSWISLYHVDSNGIHTTGCSIQGNL